MTTPGFKEVGPDDDSSFYVVPQPPFNMWRRGQVYIGKRGRRHIKFSSPVRSGELKDIDVVSSDPDDSTRKVIQSTTYARYMYQVRLWATERRYIPADKEVDHINDDALDDRFDNYQLLTTRDNTQKRTRAYRRAYVSPETIELIRSMRADGKTVCDIKNATQLTAMHIVEVIKEHCPEHVPAITAEGIDPMVVDAMLTDGERLTDVGVLFGVSQSTITRFVQRVLPHHTRVEYGKRMVAQIESLLQAGMSVAEVARELDELDANIWFYLRKYLPTLYKEIRARKAALTDAMVATLGRLLAGGYTYAVIGDALGVAEASVTALVYRYYPEYSRAQVVARKRALVREAYDLGMSIAQAVRHSGASTEFIRQLYRVYATTTT